MEDILRILITNMISKFNLTSDIENNFEYIIDNRISDLHKLLTSKGYKTTPNAIKDTILKIANESFIDYLVNFVEKFMNNILSSNIWQLLLGAPVVKSSYLEYFKTYYRESLLNKEFRTKFYDVYNLLNSDIIDRYTKMLHYRKGYGHLYMFAKPINTPNLLADFLKLAGFIYPIFLMPMRVDDNLVIIDEYLSRKDLIDKFVEISKKYINSKLGKIPDDIVETAVHSSINKRKLIFDIGLNVRADLLRTLLIISRFSTRQAHIKNKMADTPEKSLISTFKQQIDFFGLEKNLIYELEIVARENRW